MERLGRCVGPWLGVITRDRMKIGVWYIVVCVWYSTGDKLGGKDVLAVCVDVLKGL